MTQRKRRIPRVKADFFDAKWAHCVLFGCLVFLAHLAFVLYCAAPASFIEKVQALHFWDGGWFFSIVEEGYRKYVFTSEADRTQINAAFLPGYPIFAVLFKNLLGISSRAALLLTSFLAATAFWVLFLRATRTWSASLRWMGVAWVVSFPTSFYLLAAYSEGVFLACFLVWAPAVASSRQGFERKTLLFGAWMGLTRLAAFGLAFAPLFHRALLRLAGTRLSRDVYTKAVVTGGSLLGGLSAFLIYCGIRYDDFLYPFSATRHGWWARVDLEVFTSPRLWKIDPSLAWFSWEPTAFDIHAFNDFITALLFWCLLVLSGVIAYRCWKDRRIHERGVFYLLCAWALFLLPTVSNYSFMFMSMPRYLFPVVITMVFANGESLVERKTSSPSSRSRTWKVGMTAIQIAIIVAGLVMQTIFVQRFTSWQWVAGG